MNPCRCGYLADPAQACSRAPKCGADYQGRLSGPLLDRIDLSLDVPAVTPAELSLPPAAEGSKEVGTRVSKARTIQRERYKNSRTSANASADGDILYTHATPDEAGSSLLKKAAEQLRLSARGYNRVLRVARTLADLEGTNAVRKIHIAEALAYRRNTVR